jgi:hypothetical protein
LRPPAAQPGGDASVMAGTLLDGRALDLVEPPGGVGFEVPLGEDF